MTPEDIKKLPTPERDKGLQMAWPAEYLDELCISLEQRLAAVTQDLINFKSAHNVQNGRLMEQADRDSSETLASIRSMK